MEIKLKLKIKDVEIELSKDEAKELVKLLEGLTGEKIIEYRGYWYPYWPVYPSTPWVTWTDTSTTSTIRLSDDISVTYEVT